MKRLWYKVFLILGSLTLVFLGHRYFPPATKSVSEQPTPSIIGSDQSALRSLQTLAIKGRAPKTGYSRQLFGDGWQKVNGCDTREVILRRDLTQTILKPDGCTILSGVLADPYTNTTVNFVRGVTTSEAVQIDHVVALSDSWQKGAQSWLPATRQHFANDPLELLAVDGPTNQQKGDGDAASWLPPNKQYRCSYVARQIAVKVKYSLWITSAEHDAMQAVLSACPQQPLSN